jgi:two-component SAPR family response regulator
LKSAKDRTKEEMMNLLNIVSSGELLPNLQIEWVDSFKSNFANDLIDLLVDVSQRREPAFSLSELVYLADALLIYDVLNDDALKLKCTSLVKMGKNGLAQTAYNSFAKQYLSLFGAGYNYSFSQIIS